MLAEVKQEPTHRKITNYEKTRFEVSKIKINFADSIKGENEYDLESPDMLELAESIKTIGLIQPIVIRHVGVDYNHFASDVMNNSKMNYNEWIKKNPDKSDYYEVVAGRRRFTAVSKILKWNMIDAILRDYDSSIDTLAVQFQENEERKAWTDFNYANAIKMLREKKPGISTNDIAKTFNKTPDWVKKKNDHIRAIDSFEKLTGESATSHLADLSTSEINATGIIKNEAARVELIDAILAAKGKGEGLTIQEIQQKAREQGNARREAHEEAMKPFVRRFQKPVQQDLISKSDFEIYEGLRNDIMESINKMGILEKRVAEIRAQERILEDERKFRENALKNFEKEKKTIKLKNHSTKKIDPACLKKFAFDTCIPYSLNGEILKPSQKVSRYHHNKEILESYYKAGWIDNASMEKFQQTSEMKENILGEIKKGSLVFAHAQHVGGKDSGWFKCEVL